MQCTVCYEPYDIHEHRPKIVGCGHTFCLKCLRRFQTSECPSCRTPFTWPPDNLTDNFLALEETADMKFVQQSLWCETCCEAPRAACVETHEVCSWRAARSRLGGDLEAALRAEEAARDRERDALARMRAAFAAVLADASAAWSAAADQAEAAKAAEGGRPGGGHAAVRAMLTAIEASGSRTAAVEDALAVLDATEAELKIKCSGETRSFSLDLSLAGGASGASGEALERSRLALFAAYAMSRRLPPCVARRTKSEVTVTVSAPHVGPLPDVTIEFDEMPARLFEEWDKRWRRYQICRGCLESCHSQAFAPQPPDEGGAAVERGAVCLGRSSGRYYFILCHDMRDKFCLPLASSFKVVGRVTHNLGSLERAVKDIAGPGEFVRIAPSRGRLLSVEY